MDLIILDELEYVPFTKADAELLFDAVGRAYERTSLLLTTNLPFEEGIEIMRSGRLTGALLARLTFSPRLASPSPTTRPGADDLGRTHSRCACGVPAVVPQLPRRQLAAIPRSVLSLSNRGP